MKSSDSIKSGISTNNKHVYNTDLCQDTMSFDECELAILRHAVDETDELQKGKIANNEEIQKMISILENFLKRKKLICYGGTAINNILPENAQFYNYDVEIPDYDFFSGDALNDAKELADIYYAAGYSEVEAKSGMHSGTYKVFVNFIPMADITEIHPSIYNELQKEAIVINNIKYAPPNFLRMSMFLELSRPAGDVSRWEKVLKRLTLLNKYYPLKPYFDCESVDFQRKTETKMVNESERIYFVVRDHFIDQGVIFFGGYASSLYSKYMPNEERKLIQKYPDFDVLSEHPENCANLLKQKLIEDGFKDVDFIVHENIGEIIPKNIEFFIGRETVAFIYEPVACHNYNTVNIDGKDIHVATIDTMLSLYLAFLYVKKSYYNRERILCMSKFLFDVEQRNRLEQKGLLKRFSINCYGKQKTLEDIRAEKAIKYRELGKNKNSLEYQKWFLKYNPANMKTEKLTDQIDPRKKIEKIEKIEKKNEIAEDIQDSPIQVYQPLPLHKKKTRTFRNGRTFKKRRTFRKTKTFRKILKHKPNYKPYPYLF